MATLWEPTALALAKKVLVTGADGFIGSHLAELLVREGYSVRAFVCYNSSSTLGSLDNCDDDIRRSIEICTGDIRDVQSVRAAMTGCEIVFHLAALIGIPYSYQVPESYVDTNLGGTLNVLQAARDLGIERLVQASTCDVYGSARFMPMTEEHPLQAKSPYAATKIAADSLAISFYHSFAVPVVVARPFNTYGPRQSPRAVIPAIICQIAAGQNILRLGALHPTRDFSFVQDIVRGFACAARSNEAIGQVINLGSNFEVSIGDTVKLIAAVMNAEVTIEEDATRMRPQTSEVERLRADITKAEKLLAWRPEFSGLAGFRRGLRLTAEWYTRVSKGREEAVLYHV